MKKFWSMWFYVLRKELKWSCLTWGACTLASFLFDMFQKKDWNYSYKDMVRRLYPRWIYEGVFGVEDGIEAEEESA